MQLEYYFKDNFRKTGYKQGKVVKGLYEKQVVDGKKTSNSFIEEQIESVMKTEREKTDIQISAYTSEIKNSESNIQDIKKKKNEEKKKIKDSYSEKIDTLTQEKKRVESCFATYSIELSESAKSTNDMFKKLQEVLGNYAEETKDYISKQAGKAKDSLDNVLGDTKNFVLDDIKRDFLSFKAQSEEKTKGTGKNWLYLVILFLLCTFDVFAGYQAIDDLNPSMFWLIKGGLALLFVGMGIVLIYFSGDEMRKEGGNKQIGLLCILLVIAIFGGYIWLSLTDTTKDIIKGGNLNQIFSAILSDENLLMFLLRLLIIPALFVGDVIIRKIDSEAIIGSLHFGTGLNKLINRGLFFLKKRSFAKYVEEEKDHYGEILEGLKKFPIPGSDEVLFQIEKLESKIMPISNELIGKRNECDAKVKDIDAKIEDIINEEAAQLNNIDRSYADTIAKEENIIKKNTYFINVLNEQLGKAEISVREGFNSGLID